MLASACAGFGLLAETAARALAKPAPAPVGLVRFTDVASALPFAYRSNNNFTGRKYFPQPMCGGIAILDFDRDGLMDIFFTNGAELPSLKKSDASYHNCLLRNLGGGRFADVTASAGLTGADLDFCFGVAAGDYDNDGNTDLFVCNAGRNALYHNNGRGAFMNVTLGSGLDRKAQDLLSVCAAWLDYDNDGLLDLVVSHYTYWNAKTDMLCYSRDGVSRGTEAAQGGADREGMVATYCSPKMVPAVPHTLFRNLGGGRFEDVTAKAGFSTARGKGMGIGVADFNDDGAVDVFIANDTERNFLYINQGNGAFKELGLLYGVAYNDSSEAVSSMGTDAKDFNNDGWPDILYSDLQTQVFALFVNHAGRYFSYEAAASNIQTLSAHYSGWSNGFVDFDGDGLKDIYSSNGHVDYLGDNTAQHDTLWRNVDGTHFADVSQSVGVDFLREGFQRGSALADLNDDGFPDIVVTSLNQRPRILFNSADNGNHWLLLDLVGSKSSRDAVGAKVKVVTGSGRSLYGHVSTSVGFMSSSDRRVHFGLGRERDIRLVEVRWPSGATSRLERLRADRILKLVEPVTARD